MENQNPLKVLVISTNSSMNSGASHSLIGFVKLINKKYKNVHLDVLLPGHGDIENRLKEANINYSIIPFSNSLWVKDTNKKAPMFKSALRKLHNSISSIFVDLKVRNYDIIHINALTTNLGVQSAIKHKIPIVWHAREFLEEDLNKEFINQDKARFYLAAAKTRIAISQAVADKFESAFELPFNVIYNGIEFDKLQPKSEIFSNSKIRIAMVGRITEKKGHLYLVEAMRILKDSGENNFEATFVGPYDEEFVKHLQQKIKEYQLDINIMPKVEDVSLVYSASDILCVASAKEAFGRVTIEGMLSKVLVIGIDTGANLELIKDGETGYLFKKDNPQDLANKLLYISKNRDVSKKIVESAFQNAISEYSAESNADQIYKCYEQIISK